MSHLPAKVKPSRGRSRTPKKAHAGAGAGAGSGSTTTKDRSPSPLRKGPKKSRERSRSRNQKKELPDSASTEEILSHYGMTKEVILNTLIEELKKGPASDPVKSFWKGVTNGVGLSVAQGRAKELSFQTGAILLKQKITELGGEVEVCGAYTDVDSSPACGPLGVSVGKNNLSELLQNMERDLTKARNLVPVVKGKILISVCTCEHKSDKALFGFAPVAVDPSITLKPSEAKKIEEYRTEMKSLYNKMINENKTQYIELNCAATVPVAASVDKFPYPNPAKVGESDEAVEATRPKGISPLGLLLASVLLSR